MSLNSRNQSGSYQSLSFPQCPASPQPGWRNLVLSGQWVHFLGTSSHSPWRWWFRSSANLLGLGPLGCALGPQTYNPVHNKQHLHWRMGKEACHQLPREGFALVRWTLSGRQGRMIGEYLTVMYSCSRSTELNLASTSVACLTVYWSRPVSWTTQQCI